MMDSASLFTRLKRAGTRARAFSFSKILAFLYLGSFLAHLVIVLIFIHQPIALDDMFQYDMLARSIRAGEGYRWYSRADVEVLRPYYAQFLDIDHLHFPQNGLRTTFRAPGYPFFLALVYLFTSAGYRFALARVVQAALSATLAPMTAMLARQAGLGEKVALHAGIGMSLYPLLLFYPIGLASENMYVPLGAATLIAVVASVRHKAWGWTLLAGGLGGLTMLTRSIFAPFIGLAGLWIACQSPKRVRAGLIFLLVAFGTCLPWSLRNSLVMGRPAFVENSLGYNLFIGYNPAGDGGFDSAVAIQPMNILDDGQREQYCLAQALGFIRQDPGEAVRRVFVRLEKFVGPEDREFFYFYSNNLLGAIPQPWLGLIYALLVLPRLATLLGGMAGLCRLADRGLAVVVIFFLAGYAFPHLLVIAEPRFHLAWLPVLMPFAVYGWQAGWRSLAGRKNLVLLAILLAVLLFFTLGFLADWPKLVTIMSPGGNQSYFSY